MGNKSFQIISLLFDRLIAHMDMLKIVLYYYNCQKCSRNSTKH